MRIIRSEDFYSINVAGYVGEAELASLNVLYLPFIGVVSLALYLTLLRTRNYKNGQLINHEFLQVHLQVNSDQLLTAFRRLEAVSLISTYKKEHEQFNEYIYVLAAPKNPAAFARDEVLMYLLENVVGEREAGTLLRVFALDEFKEETPDVSADFASVFGSDFAGASVSGAQKISLANEVANITTPFDDALFFNQLTKLRQILPTALSKEELVKVKRFATLFNLTETALAEKVGDFYEAAQPKGKKVDIDRLFDALSQLVPYQEIMRPLVRRKVKKVTSESELAQMINKMEEMRPHEFLYELNNFTKVAYRDQEIIKMLAFEYLLSDAAINALIYYALETFDNVLPKAAIEKLASSIQRKKLTSALDVYDALKTPVSYKKTQKKTPKKEAVQDTDESLDDLLADVLGKDEN